MITWYSTYTNADKRNKHHEVWVLKKQWSKRNSHISWDFNRYNEVIYPHQTMYILSNINIHIMHLLVCWYVHLHVICSNLYNNTTPWQHSKLEDIFPVRGLPLLLSVNHQVVAEKNRGSLCLKIAQTFQNTYLRFPSHSQDSKRRRGWWRVGLHVITTFKKANPTRPP